MGAVPPVPPRRNAAPEDQLVELVAAAAELVAAAAVLVAAAAVLVAAAAAALEVVVAAALEAVAVAAVQAVFRRWGEQYLKKEATNSNCSK